MTVERVNSVLQPDEGHLREGDALSRLVQRIERLEKLLPSDKSSAVLFRLAVEASPTALLMIDARGAITLVNAQCERLFGYLRDELLEQRVELLVPERFRREHPQFRESFFRKPRARAMGVGRDLYGLHRDGSEIPIEIGLSPIRTDTGEEVVLASIVDITERKRAEAMFRGAVEASPTAMIMVDRTGCIQLTNRQAEETFGYTRSELLGQSIEMLVPARNRREHPRLRQQFGRAPIARAMGGDRELYAVHKSGRSFPVEIGLNPLQTQDGDYVLASVVDVTDRRRLEGELKAANRGLEDRVRERTQELALRNAELLELNTELERFAYVVSHDLKEPLRMVVSFTSRLAQEFSSEVGERGRQYIGFASSAAQRMHDLLADLLRYSQLDTRASAHTEVSTAECVDGALHSLQILLAERRLEVIVPDPLPSVRGDASQIGQVFQNLLANSAKFCEPGSVVRITWRSLGDFHEFCVADDGPGISPDYHERIFEIFQRLDHSKEGTGVGLSIVKRIVQRHGGTIRIESNVGEGASFLFTLPAPRGEAEA